MFDPLEDLNILSPFSPMLDIDLYEESIMKLCDHLIMDSEKWGYDYEDVLEDIDDAGPEQFNDFDTESSVAAGIFKHAKNIARRYDKTYAKVINDLKEYIENNIEDYEDTENSEDKEEDGSEEENEAENEKDSELEEEVDDAKKNTTSESKNESGHKDINEDLRRIDKMLEKNDLAEQKKKKREIEYDAYVEKEKKRLRKEWEAKNGNDTITKSEMQHNTPSSYATFQSSDISDELKKIDEKYKLKRTK